MTLRAEIASRILPVPEALVIEADEYLFTMAAMLSEIVILQGAFTYYGIHGGNLYLSGGEGKTGLRRKQRVMEALATALRKKLTESGALPEVVECVVEIVQADADQMRLQLDGGKPWETLRVERKIYEVMHIDAPQAHRIFRTLSMVPAMVLPPRWFYGGRAWLGSRGWYHRMRKKTVPIPETTRATSLEEN